jgi:transcriptional regulator GlxA family with amidase domain
MHYGLVLFPGFEALDVFGPLEFLNLLSRSVPMELHILASTLAPVSTRPPLAGSTQIGQLVLPTHTFAAPPPHLDVLLVPGGHGTRAPLADAVRFIADAYPALQYALSICTGAALLARAGVLDGRRATTNKKAWAWATAQGPRVRWEPVARWCVDGNVWTAAGVAAGMDCTLAFIAHVHGRNIALALADDAEYEWHQDAGWDPYAAIHGLVSGECMRGMEKHELSMVSPAGPPEPGHS